MEGGGWRKGLEREREVEKGMERVRGKEEGWGVWERNGKGERKRRGKQVEKRDGKGSWWKRRMEKEVEEGGREEGNRDEI